MINKVCMKIQTSKMRSEAAVSSKSPPPPSSFSCSALPPGDLCFYKGFRSHDLIITYVIPRPFRTCRALSRSSQSWSSYSGYIRDFASICHALHRQNNLDTVQTVYRNITAEKVHLLRAMRRGEDERGRAFGMFGQMLGRFEVQLEVSRRYCCRLKTRQS
jgi:hypothetical protein